MNLDVSTLELALAVSDYINEQLARSEASLISVPRDIAELAVAFADAAAESLQGHSCRPGRAIN